MVPYARSYVTLIYDKFKIKKDSKYLIISELLVRY